MAFDITKLTAPPVIRYRTEELPENVAKTAFIVNKEKITEGAIKQANRTFDPFNELGIMMRDGKPPVRNGVPSMFILKRDQAGNEKPVSLEEAGVEYGDREFWNQAQLGNLFAYPAGSENPSQIKADFRFYPARISVSAPITPDDMPAQIPPARAAHVYRKPGRLARIINSIFPRYRRADCEIYKDQQSLKDKIKVQNRKRGENKALEDEVKELRNAEKHADEIKANELIRSNHAQMKNEQFHKNAGKQVYWDMVRPDPVWHEEYEKKGKKKDEPIKNEDIMEEKEKPAVKEEPKKKKISNFYTREEFDSLEKLDKKLEDYVIGGKPLSQDEYCGLVSGASLLPKNALRGYETAPEYDATLLQTMVNMGYEKEKAGEIIANNTNTIITTDLMKGDLRTDQGKVLPTTVNPARIDVFNALEDYKKGNKDPLANIIARGIAVAVQDTGNHKSAIGGNVYNHTDFAAATADLMDRDKDLEKLVMEKGVDEADLDALRGMNNMSKADSARREAKVKLSEAAANGNNDMKYGLKQKYAEDIVLANLMEAKVNSENYLQKQKEDPAADLGVQMQKEAEKNGLMFDGNQVHEFAKNPEARPMPPVGKFYSDQVGAIINGRSKEFNVHPDSMIDLCDAEGVEKMKNVAKAIVEKEGLAELSVRELNDKLCINKELRGAGLMLKADEVMKERPELDADESMSYDRINEIDNEELDPLNTAMIMK